MPIRGRGGWNRGRCRGRDHHDPPSTSQARTGSPPLESAQPVQPAPPSQPVQPALRSQPAPPSPDSISPDAVVGLD
ncbi:hypothetical protein RIF29_15798 [Crotalaria pallida]|uniref:Uncharacterized protein n=1 Tax=Crotalaria pallida TaxID=3830 RepID=A0AAN9FG34_CROPI